MQELSTQPAGQDDERAVSGSAAHPGAARFSHIHLDIVGPLPCTKEGFTHLLTAVDRSTRWGEALLLKATAAAEAFITRWVARYSIQWWSLMTGVYSSLWCSGQP
jgi:hypothetical protein